MRTTSRAVIWQLATVGSAAPCNKCSACHKGYRNGSSGRRAVPGGGGSGRASSIRPVQTARDICRGQLWLCSE